MMVHMCLEREKINEQITILNYKENSKAFTGIERREAYNLPRLQVLAASELSRLVHWLHDHQRQSLMQQSKKHVRGLEKL